MGYFSKEHLQDNANSYQVEGISTNAPLTTDKTNFLTAKINYHKNSMNQKYF